MRESIERLDGVAIEDVRRLAAEFFADTYFHTGIEPSIRAKVHMRTNEHDPEQFDRVIAGIRLYHTNENDVIQELGGVSLSLRTLLTCPVETWKPHVADYMRTTTDLNTETLGKVLSGICETVRSYAAAFVEAGPEPLSVIEARERAVIRDFLTGQTVHEVAGYQVSVRMPVTYYDYEQFKDDWATIAITRCDGSLVGHTVTTMGRVYEGATQSLLEEFDLTYSEMIELDEHLMYNVNRFEYLGEQPRITAATPFENAADDLTD